MIVRLTSIGLIFFSFATIRGLQIPKNETLPTSSPTTLNLPTLAFHRVHSSNIRITQNGKLALRNDAPTKGILFTDRSIELDEKIRLKLYESPENLKGALWFGFTNVRPDENNDEKLLSDLYRIKKPFCVWRLFGERIENGSVFWISVNTNGFVRTRLVRTGVNEKEEASFRLNGIDMEKPIWPVFDLFGKTVGIELLDLSSTRYTLASVPDSNGISGISTFNRHFLHYIVSMMVILTVVVL